MDPSYDLNRLKIDFYQIKPGRNRRPAIPDTQQVHGILIQIQSKTSHGSNNNEQHRSPIIIRPIGIPILFWGPMAILEYTSKSRYEYSRGDDRGREVRRTTATNTAADHYHYPHHYHYNYHPYHYPCQ